MIVRAVEWTWEERLFNSVFDAAGEHPLSWNQRSLWFLNRLAPESSAYTIAGAPLSTPTASTYRFFSAPSR